MSNRGKKIDVSMRAYQAALRRLGFVRTYYGAKTQGSPWVQTYECVFAADEVKVEVQLWGDGQHRATYWHANIFVDEAERSPYGCMSTKSVDFGTVEQMLAVVEDQRTHWLRGEKEVEQEYVRRCLAAEREGDEPETRDVIRKKLERRRHLTVVEGGTS